MSMYNRCNINTCTYNVMNMYIRMYNIISMYISYIQYMLAISY